MALLGGCSATKPSPKATTKLHQGLKSARKSARHYTVRPGDTLYRIAKLHKLSVKHLVATNNLRSNRIYPGQKLRISYAKRSAKPKLPPKAWKIPGSKKPFTRPTTGRIKRRFGEGKPNPCRGIEYLTRGPVAVKAAAAGIVTALGNHPYTIGNFIIIKHRNNFSTVYGYIDNIRVRQLQQIKQGQTLGTSSPVAGIGYLFHFEIRRKGVAVNPERYLP